MSPRPRRLAIMAIAAGAIALLPAVAPGQAGDRGGNPELAADSQASTDDDSEPASDAGQAEAIRGELVKLADAWRLGGGRFGYPFWDKAGQRWTSGQITTTMYREYVTGYRDRMRGGCKLLDAIDVEEDISGDVRELVRDSCRARLDALGEQQQWLDALVDADVPAPAGTDAVAAAERLTELQEDAVEHEEAYRASLQESYLQARSAMELAQATLDQAGLERLPEDAFV